VTPLAANGLALGIEEGQEYAAGEARLEPGSSIVLYTDGVVECRRDGELNGEARLDEVLARHRDLAPQELAESILEDCRRFAGGDLGDDCALVCLRLTDAG
jgi:sigma-B regulation protein RsbU (phosphoserine phosphatase)